MARDKKEDAQRAVAYRARLKARAAAGDMDAIAQIARARERQPSITNAALRPSAQTPSASRRYARAGLSVIGSAGADSRRLVNTTVNSMSASVHGSVNRPADTASA